MWSSPTEMGRRSALSCAGRSWRCTSCTRCPSTTAGRIRRGRGAVVEAPGRGWRRVVPSPIPVRIIEREAIEALIRAGFVVISTGGGGIPGGADEHGRAGGGGGGGD